MKNSLELRNELIAVFQGVKSKRMQLKVAAELCNAAGKIIDTVKLELVYAQLSKETPNIPFLAHAAPKLMTITGRAAGK